MKSGILSKEERREILQRLVDEAQELGLGYNMEENHEDSSEYERQHISKRELQEMDGDL